MANHLDLEEQEQLDQLKHWWKQYGNAITWLLIVILGAFAAWNLFQRWERSQATQAAAMSDELEKVVGGTDTLKVAQVFNDLKEQFPKTALAQQAGLLVAKYYLSADKAEDAKSALNWVANTSTDEGYKTIAKLRLAALLVEAKDFDKALGVLDGTVHLAFEALVSDRKGDIFALQGKKKEATIAYKKAYLLLDDRDDYRRLVEVKLNALGVDAAVEKGSIREEVPK